MPWPTSAGVFGMTRTTAVPSGRCATSVAVGTQFLVSADADEELVYEITKALWHERSRALLQTSHPQARQIERERAFDEVLGFDHAMEAVEVLRGAGVSGAPVLRGSRLVGVISSTDILELEATAPAPYAKRMMSLSANNRPTTRPTLGSA